MLLKNRLITGLAISLMAQSVIAHDHSPTVLASIQPLALLSAQVTGDSKTHVILPPNRSPHHYQLKVSERKAISEADIIFWVGDNLEMFLSKAIKQYPEASMDFSSMIAANEHSEEHHKEHGHEEEEHGHEKDHKDDHDAHQHHNEEEHHEDEHDSHEDHADEAHHEDEHEHYDHSGHDHSGPDPHIWLAPENLATMASALATRLSAMDPENASRYASNLEKIHQDLDATDTSLKTRLKSISDKPFIVLHPALHHFVEHYGLNQVDAIVETPESGLSAKHLRELNQQEHIACVLGEIGENNNKAKALAKKLNAGYAELDILGRQYSPQDGAGAIIEGIAVTLLGCMQ